MVKGVTFPNTALLPHVTVKGVTFPNPALLPHVTVKGVTFPNPAKLRETPVKPSKKLSHSNKKSNRQHN